LVKTSLSLFASGLLQSAFCLRAAVDQAARCGLLFGLVPLGALPRGAQIDEVAHAKLGGTGCVASAILACEGRERITPTVSRWITAKLSLAHSAQSPLLGSVAIPAASDKTRLL